jgi:hypothetical protein
VEPNPELRLEEARSLREGVWRIAQLAQNAAEKLDTKIEDETLDGYTEDEELREALGLVQALSLENSEELDAYQNKYAR